MSISRSIFRALASPIGPILALHAATAAPASVQQRTFASPEEALEAVIDDLKSDNVADLVRIFGPRSEPLLHSGDPVADKNARERFLAFAGEAHHFDGSGDTLTLVIGK